MGRNEEEKTINMGELKEAEVKRIRLGGTCEILDATLPRYEIEIPEIALHELGVDYDKKEVTDQIQFIKENGRVYMEKA